MATAVNNNVVIIGAGIIGVATAHYLSRLSPRSTIHLLDSSPSLFSSASGKAAGFLARDWFLPATTSLGALSFDLHRQLAEEHNGLRRWGYSPSTAFSLPEAQLAHGSRSGEDWLLEGVSRSTSAPTYVKGDDFDALPLWLEAGRENTPPLANILSSVATTAQVNPLQLCQFLLDQCRSRNVEVHHPVFVTSTVASSDGTITGLAVRFPDDSNHILPCDTLILTAGVWTPRVLEALFPNATVSLPITHLSGHSVVLHSQHWGAVEVEPQAPPGTGCHAIFTTDASADFSPEIFSRAGGDIYLAGLNTTAVPVPELASEVQPQPASIGVLLRVARKLLGDHDFDVLQTGFCHRPVSNSGAPLLTRLTPHQAGAKFSGGLWVSAGHGPWGISLSLGTGLVLSELVLGKSPSADVSGLGLHV